MRVGNGLHAEILSSLAIIMLTATALLTAFFFRTHAAQVESLQELLGRALLAEARAPTFAVGAVSSGVDWWTVSESGQTAERSDGAGPIDEESRSLAREARRARGSILRSGAPWDPIRFAASTATAGDVAVARIPSVVSRSSLITLLVLDALVFAAFGSYLLRQRVIAPMRELAGAARTIGEAGPGARVRLEGVDEVQEVAWAFNEMSEALEHRTSALEKAVRDLRDANAQLSQARAGLVRAERLAAVGSLAAGVAHEVGNPMGALLAFLELAQREDSLNDEVRGYLGRAAEQGGRVREILRQLLDFSRPPQAKPSWVDLVHVGEQVLGLVRAQKCYAAVEFELLRCDGVTAILADESMIAQILLNLVVNGADAVREERKPRIVLKLQPAHLCVRVGESPEATEARREWDAIECQVSDNGPGISEEDRERIFDPFFTTKPPGEGTGLGLANAQRLAEELGGVLDCTPRGELGGATLSLRLAKTGGAAKRVGTEVRGA